MFLAKSRTDYHILLDNHVSAQVNRCHVPTHDHLRVHHVFALHADIFEAFQDDVLADLVLLLREEVELRLVVLWHWLHLCETIILINMLIDYKHTTL